MELAHPRGTGSSWCGYCFEEHVPQQPAVSQLCLQHVWSRASPASPTVCSNPPGTPGRCGDTLRLLPGVSVWCSRAGGSGYVCELGPACPPLG